MSAEYRVWHIPQVPMHPFRVSVSDIESARLVVDVLADYDEFQFKNRIKPDYANASGVEQWDPDCREWHEVDADEPTS